MAKILSVKAREILDSRGNPTVECALTTNKGTVTASVPSGASTGAHEAHELRDGGSRYLGMGVLKAVKNVELIGRKIRGMDPAKQEEIDSLMIKLDGTKNFSKLGANAALAVSIAVCKAAAQAKGIPAYEYISQKYKTQKKIPKPFFNIINGGKHAGSKLAVQELMISPRGKNFGETLMQASEIYHLLKELLEHNYGKSATNVGDEGGFAPPMVMTQDALNAIKDAIVKMRLADKVDLAIDAAATSFYKHGKYYVDQKELSPEQMIEYYKKIVHDNPSLISIEDPFDEESFSDFAKLKKETNVQIVGDDLTVTNTARIQKAIDEGSCSCLLLKMNQIGTITEAVNAVKLARAAGWKIMASHRSGETDDNFLAHFSVGIGADQIKAGAPCRGERLAKYNELLRISEKVKKYSN